MRIYISYVRKELSRFINVENLSDATVQRGGAWGSHGRLVPNQINGTTVQLTCVSR